MPRNNLPAVKTSVKTRLKYRVPDAYDVFTPSQFDDNDSTLIKKKSQRQHSFQSEEMIGPVQKTISRAHPEVQNIAEVQRRKSSGVQRNLTSTDSQRTLRYNDFELIHRSEDNMEYPIDIEPADSVSNAGQRIKVSQFPDFNWQTADERKSSKLGKQMLIHDSDDFKQNRPTEFTHETISEGSQVSRD